MTETALSQIVAPPDARTRLPALVIARRVALSALGWALWFGVVLGLDLESGGGKLQDVPVLSYVSLSVLGYMGPWYLARQVFRRVGGRLVRRLSATAIAIVLWAFAMHPVSRLFGLPASMVEILVAAVSVAAVSLCVGETLRGFKARRRLARIEQLRIDAEQQLLGAQLAPHTLFNLLNTLYAVSLSRPEQLAPLVLDLAQMMEPLATDERAEFHAAAVEWRFVEAYRRFALARLDPRSRIELAFKGDPQGALPAFLTATLFENAVKHGMDDLGHVDIDVELAVRADGFLLRMSNRLPDVAAPKDGLRAGLNLVRRRLEYLYPYRHRFEAGPRQQAFEVVMEAW